MHDVQDAARALTLEIRLLQAVTEKEIDAAFKIIADEKILALAVGSDPFFRHAIPHPQYQFREHATELA